MYTPAPIKKERTAVQILIDEELEFIKNTKKFIKLMNHSYFQTLIKNSKEKIKRLEKLRDNEERQSLIEAYVEGHCMTNMKTGQLQITAKDFYKNKY